MHLYMPYPPSSSTASQHAELFNVHKNGSKGGSGPQLRQWSSLIGIITAMVGNLLISIALNTQRYAHLRIEREHNAAKDALNRRDRQSPTQSRNYGTSQQNGDAGYERGLDGGPQRPQDEDAGADGDVDREQEPLKRSYDSRGSLQGDEKSEDEDDTRPSYLRSPYWWIGIVLMTIGEAGNFLAYGFAPASIVSPLGVVALISNCVIAPFMLKERFRLRDLAGVLVAIGGVVTVVLSAKQGEKKLGPDELLEAIMRWEFLLYVCITTVAIIALMFASNKYGSRTILVDLGLVGLFGGYTALSTKGVASLLSDSLFDAFTYPITYPLVAVLVFSAVMQIRYLNRALQSFDSTMVIPTQFVLFTLSVITGSAVLYRDFESTTAERTGKFVCGCLLTFFGVYLITSKRARRDDEEEEEEPLDEEEGIRLIDEEAADVRVVESRWQDRPPQIKHQPPVSPPLTPRQQTAVQPPSLLASSAPSISITLDPNTSSTSLLPPADNPWLASSESLAEGSESVSFPPSTEPDIYQTPPQTLTSRNADDSESTPYYTPATNKPQKLRASNLPLERTNSSPADPETPTKKQKAGGRAASPPKADSTLRPSPQRPPVTPTGNSLVRSARGSIGRLLAPSPLMNPLSSSLSAVVADSLRRGEGTPHSLRRHKSQRSQRQSQGASGTNRSVEDVTATSSSRRRSVHLDQALNRQISQEQPDGRTESRTKTRLRAMSDGVTGLLGKLNSTSGSSSSQKDEQRSTGAEGGPS